MPPFAGPTLCCPTPDLPYTRSHINALPYASDLPYAALHKTCPTPVTYPTLVTYPMPTTYLTPKDLLNSEFLVCLQVISGHGPLCTFAEPSGA